MTTDNQELDRAFYQLEIDLINYRNAKFKTLVEMNSKSTEIIDRAKAATLKWSDKRLLDSIGSDEDASPRALRGWIWAEARNELRAELRNKLEANHEG